MKYTHTLEKENKSILQEPLSQQQWREGRALGAGPLLEGTGIPDNLQRQTGLLQEHQDASCGVEGLQRGWKEGVEP